MSFVRIDDRGFFLDSGDQPKLERDEGGLINALRILIEKGHIYKWDVTCGVTAGPDFGYFDLASRFWRASLGIYFLGLTNCFWERGAGFSEPWLFNARHSLELFLKGFLLYASWFKEVHEDILAPDDRLRIDHLKEKFISTRDVHSIAGLYENYKREIETIITNWDTKLCPAPTPTKILLSKEREELLIEIHDADENSFRFRYPSLKKASKEDHLQKLDWRYPGDKELFPNTGLPRISGYLFDHVKVINSLHDLIQEIYGIQSYLESCWECIAAQSQPLGAELLAEISEIIESRKNSFE